MSKESKTYKNMPKKVYIRTFGCQMNDRDSEVILGLFVDRGYSIVEVPEDADIILINTCSVRGHAEDRALSLAGSFKKLHPKSTIGIIGCMAQNYKQELFRRLPHIDFIAGPSGISYIPDIVESVRENHRHIAALGLSKYRPEKIYSFPHPQDKKHSYVNISQGCNNYCSYCVVPYVRGNLRHRRHEKILKEIKKLVSLGIEDITLLGQNVNSYRYRGQRIEGRGQRNIDFVELLKMVNDMEGLKSFSFVTSHPKDVSVKLFCTIRDLPKLKKYLHLPVQSGSDRILKLMNRGYMIGHYKYLVDTYRRIVAGGKLSTDIIVGFPTETEDDFQATCSLINELKFNSAYIFKYSPRPKTGAAKMPDNIVRSEKERRHRLLLDLQKKISLNLKKSTCILSITCYLLLATCYPSFAASLKKAQGLFLKSDYESVINECRQALRSSYRQDERAELNYLLAQAHMKINDLSEAEVRFKTIMKGYKTSSVYEKALLGLGDVYFLAEDYVSAKDIYLQFKGLNSDLTASVYYKLAQVNFKLGNLEQGRGYLLALKKDFPLSFEAKKVSLLDAQGLFFTVQVGAFSNKKNALSLLKDLKGRGFNSYIEPLKRKDRILYRVRVGKFNSKKEAEKVEEDLSNQGFPTKIFP